MRFNQRKKKFLLSVIVFFLILTYGIQSSAQIDFFQNEGISAESLQKLQTIINIVESYYIEEVDEEQLMEYAFKGIMDGLDDYSYYLTERDFEDKKIDIEGEYGGIGLYVAIIENELTVVSPIEGTPGHKAGLQAGDIIKEVDGEPTAQMSQEEAVDKMRGAAGTEVELLILRENEEEPFLVEIVRADVQIPYIISNMETDKIGYIQITNIMENVSQKLTQEIKNLQAEGAEALILDLRNNPGGLLNESIKVVSHFIDEGKILEVRQREDIIEVWNVDRTVETFDIPLAVIINQGSASGSEIVAGALQEYEKAKLIGKTSFGKGSVQNLIPLQDGSALNLTIATFHLPSGANIYEDGVSPDIEVEFDFDDEEDKQLLKAIEVLEEKLENN